MKTKLHFALAVAFLSTLNSQLSTLRAQGTAFTYQGRLTDNASPANGNYDLKFYLRDAPTSGNPVGTTNTIAPVPISNGLFTVTLDFGAGVFTGPPRWLEIGVRTNGSIAAHFTLSPRQALTPSPYATYAASATTAGTASSVASGTVVGSLNGLRDTVTLQAGNNVTITPNGNSLTIAAAGVGGSGIWTLNGNNTYYNAGNVGLGTTTPSSKLEIAAQDGLAITGLQPFLTLRDTNSGNALSRIQGGGGDVNLLTASYISGANPLSFLKLANNGNVGIGSASPVGKLEVVAQDALRLIGPQPFLTILDSSAGYARGRIASVGGDLNLFTESYLSGANPLSFLRLANNGNVGIGSATPVAKLEVVGVGGGGDALGLIGYQPFLTLLDSNAGYARSRIQGAGGDLFLETHDYTLSGNPLNGLVVLKNGTGFVGIGTTTPVAKLHAETSLANTAAVYGNATGASGVGVYGQSAAGAAVHAEGNATQARDKGGFVKAMAYINPFLPAAQYVVRSYNSQAGATITVTRVGAGNYYVDFGFKVNDRFVSVTGIKPIDPHTNLSAAFDFVVGTPNQVEVKTFITNVESLGDDAAFMIIIY